MAIAYLSENRDAEQTRHRVEEEGVECLVIRADLSSAANCHRTVERVVAKWSRLDVLVDSAHSGVVRSRAPGEVRRRHAAAPAYVFLASQDASFITGQLIHVNGGGHISA